MTVLVKVKCMDIVSSHCSKLNITSRLYQLDNGFRIYFVPLRKPGYKYGFMNVSFGSAHHLTEFWESNDGIAHVLEHALMYKGNRSIVEDLNHLHLHTDAYLEPDHTSFIIWGQDGFEQGIVELLDKVLTLDIGEAELNREKAVIMKECAMLKDDVGRAAFINMLQCLYPKHPVRYDPCGCMERVNAVGMDLLSKYHQKYFTLSNMFLLILGDESMDMDTIVSHADKYSRDSKYGNLQCPDRKDFAPPLSHLHEESMQIHQPYFTLGFKDNTLSYRGIDSLQYETALVLLYDLLLGPASDTYAELYNDGFIDDRFTCNCIFGEDHIYSYIEGNSTEPVRVRQSLQQQINRWLQIGIPETITRQCLRRMMLNQVKTIESPFALGASFISSILRGFCFWDRFQPSNYISSTFLLDTLKQHFQFNYSTLSLMKPLAMGGKQNDQ